MEKQEFNKRDFIYDLIFNFIIKNNLKIMNTEPHSLSKRMVKTLIDNRGVLLNQKELDSYEVRVMNQDTVEIPKFKISFVCEKNEKYSDTEHVKKRGLNKFFNEFEKTNSDLKEEELVEESQVISISTMEVDTYISNYLKEKLNVSAVSEIPENDFKKAFSLIINLFQLLDFDSIRKSIFSYELTDFIKNRLHDSHIIKELDISKSQLNFDGKLVRVLILGKAERENNLSQMNDNLLNGSYDKSLFKYLQDYRKIYLSDSFQYLINPLINNKLSSALAIENLLKPVNKSVTVEGIEPKFHHYEDSKPVFVSYFQLLKESDDYSNRFFHPVAEYLFKLLKENCNTAIEKSAHLIVEPTNRKYNFTNADRLEQEIILVVSNEGEGLAKSVLISSASNSFHFPQINIGILKPNEKREVSVVAIVRFDSDFKPELLIQYHWEEVSGKQNTSNCEIEFQIQKADVPWEDLKKQNPYSNSIIDNAEKLFGRKEILQELKANILSDNIESYKLWGQKRVGKSSIVKTLKSILEEEEKVIIVYRSLGGLKNTDAVITLNSLGESLCTEVYEEIDRKIKDPSVRERLRAIVVPQFNGSLYPLETYIKQLKRIDVALKFIFILDEFDRINEEFFLPGNLGETLSLSIGKGLNENRYIGFILVGSENMHLLDRHGINYNSFQEKEVDTFHKQREYKSFVQIIKGPVTPHLNYSDEAIERIFFASNGNPYFANLICANVFKNAYKFKDNEIDSHAVVEALSLIINSSQKSHFEHYWSDGITEESNIKKERKADIRRRILVSFSMASNPSVNSYPSKSDIERNFKRPIETEYEIEKYEIENTITEFVNRKIFVEGEFNQIRILPNIFESWLCGKGKTLMIEGVSDLEALQREIDLEKELALKSDELNRLSENYHFKEKKIAPEKFAQFFNQFGSASKQRRVFKLIDSIFFISKEEIFDFYRKEIRNIFTKTEIFLKEKAKTIYREDIELYTFQKYFSENVSLIESFKVLNHIRAQKLLKSIQEDSQAWKRSKADEIIIIEPIIESYSDIQKELSLLLNDEIKIAQVSIRIVSFVITTKAKADLISATSSFSNLKLVSLMEVEETKIKPFIQGTEIFENIEEANQAFYEVRNHFPNTSKDVLLILFEDYCPSKSCPVLWFKSSQFNPIFYNEHGILEQSESNETILEQRRLKLYHANVQFSQGINKFIIEHLKKKAVQQNLDNWFHVSLIPKSVMSSIYQKSLADNQKDPIETYFDFADYKRIIEFNNELVPYFKDASDGLMWLEKLNELRRLPSHPEKPIITEKNVDDFEKMKNKILPKLS